MISLDSNICQIFEYYTAKPCCLRKKPLIAMPFSTAGLRYTSELQAWASERVPERAAAPKAVTILPALPVTAVGKLYKLALRADATRRELEHALAAVAGIDSIRASVEDGSILATVEIDGSVGEPTVKAILDRYAINWKVTVRT